jgi:hypothetical protein
MKTVVTILIILAVAGCTGIRMGSTAFPPNASSSDCLAAGGATYDALSGACIGAAR